MYTIFSSTLLVKMKISIELSGNIYVDQAFWGKVDVDGRINLKWDILCICDCIEWLQDWALKVLVYYKTENNLSVKMWLYLLIFTDTDCLTF